MYPPSLPEDVKARAFRASNGELGIVPSDTGAFLAACRSDAVEVSGWELWVIDHSWDFDTNSLIPAAGVWWGLIPVKDGDGPAVIGGEGDVDETERQLASTDLSAEVQAAWLPHVRINFALDN